ncbi:histidine kinase dimerization/phosphoacceptor domain-containing protein [Sphaerisporangium sp. B11E5]|uniref:sensor histidine kinase n=1 Tax=Sphaerisporangium sp. B11E5 TaxID=3153563 RepID=UPI00325CA50C
MTTPAALEGHGPPPTGSSGGARSDRLGRAPRARRDQVADGAFFSLAVCFTVLVLLDGLDHRLPPEVLAVDLALGGLSCLGVLVRRRRPVGLAVAAGLFGVFSLAASGVALIALFTVAVHRRFAVVALVVAWHSITATLSLLARPDMSVTHWSQAVLGVVLVTAILAWGMFVRARRQSLSERARRAEAERELLVARARQLERNRIAREMHDVLAHRISLVSLHAGALELRLGASSGEDARAAGVIRDCAHQALEDLREVIGVLREDPAAPTATRRTGPSPPWSTCPSWPRSPGAPGLRSCWSARWTIRATCPRWRAAARTGSCRKDSPTPASTATAPGRRSPSGAPPAKG